MTKEDFMMLTQTSRGKPMDINKIGRMCEYPPQKYVYLLKWDYGVDIDEILDLADACGIKGVVDEDSRISVRDYNDIEKAYLKKHGLPEKPDIDLGDFVFSKREKMREEEDIEDDTSS